MKLYIFSVLHSIWLDPESNRQAGVAEKLCIHLSSDCVQGHVRFIMTAHTLEVLLGFCLLASHFSIFMG